MPDSFATLTTMTPLHSLSSLSIPKEVFYVISIVILAWLLIYLSRKLIRLFRDFMNSRATSAEDTRRIETLARVFRYVSTVVISLVTIMLILSELGLSIAPILGAAGVVGIAIGFGAQSLVKDFFNGFFLLLENQIRQGDVIEVCGRTGTVEDITLRYVRLRDTEGSVHYVPNSQITLVTNKSCDFAFAVIDVGIAYHENLTEVYAILHEVGELMQADEKINPKILAELEIQGVQELTHSTCTLRCRFKTVALEQWEVRRAFLGKLKCAFDAHGIEMYPPAIATSLPDKQMRSTVLSTPTLK